MSSRIVAEASGYDREEQGKLGRLKTKCQQQPLFSSYSVDQPESVGCVRHIELALAALLDRLSTITVCVPFYLKTLRFP